MNCRLMLLSMLALMLFYPGTAAAVTVRDAVFSTRHAGRVVFSHAGHINRKEMANNCRACHDVLFDLRKKRHYSMAEMEKGKSCGACHNGKKAFPLTGCARCHQTREIVYKVRATGPTAFSHKAHLVISPDCGACHPSIFAAGPNRRFSMADMEKGKSCGACHNGKKAFSVKQCDQCHPSRELVFEEKSTGNVVFSHKLHIGLYSCEDCHVSRYATVRSRVKVSMQEMEAGRSCGSCHDGKSAFSVKEKCESCHTM